MLKRFYLFASVLLFCSFGIEGNYKVIPDQSGLVIETPSLAKRAVRKLRLDNGLEALLISDPESHESGAALAVHVGSWDDPEERPGMAHFVEHLLFLGTEKYPEEEGYTRYLDSHGGQRNAFTMADRTVYSFSVSSEGFDEALDRFGHFFIAPLFNPSGVERECKAIHQEYCKNIPSDGWRMHFVKKELANPKHPFHRFCIGNQDTLAQISQDELKKWYACHYSANLMHLVVYSSKDLDTLEKQVATLFSEVHTQECAPSHTSEPLSFASEQPQLCLIAPVQELQLLELSWELPRSFGTDIETHVDKLLSHVLGHEGGTSLLALLKQENLANGLAAGCGHLGHDQMVFTLSINLTKQGVEAYEKVIERCFQALAHLKQEGIPRYLFDEVCTIEENRYRFQARQDLFEYVTELASHMVEEPLATYPKKVLIPTQFNPIKVKQLLSHLTPKGCFYSLVAPSDLTGAEWQKKEKWLGADYALVSLENKISDWERVERHTAIHLPRPNPFLPKKIALHALKTDKKETLPQVHLIANEPSGKIYTARDEEFLVPKVCYIFNIKTPLIDDANPLSHAYADLFCYAVEEELKDSSYEAQLAGLHFDLSPSHGSLNVTITGYSDKAHELLNVVAKGLKQAHPTAVQCEKYKELFARSYKNTVEASALKEGHELLKSLLYKNYPGPSQKGAALERFSFEEFTAFCQDVLKECYVEGMLFGNCTVKEAASGWKLLKDTLQAKPYPPALHPKVELATLPTLKHPSYLKVASDNPANALILTTDCGHFSFERRAAQEILTKGLEEPFFSELRTRQQTAYLVTNFSQELERHLYNFFAIQSSSHASRDLLARFELFIESSLQELTDKVIPEERFESIRTAFVQQLKHPADSLITMGELLHKIAFEYEGDFEWVNKRITAFEKLNYSEFVEFAKEFLGKENRKRLAICVTGALPDDEKNLSYRKVTTPALLRSEICYEPKP